jgi:glucans biosynthesis protein C
VLFALGAWAGQAGSLGGLTDRARRLGWIALAAVAALAAVLGFEQERGTLGSALHGAGWPTMLMAVLYGIISVAFSVWFTAIIRARWSGSGSLLVRAGKASYATYFLRPPVLTAIMVIFGSLAVAPELKLLIVAVLAVPVCFLAGDAATRFLGICRARVRRLEWSTY